MRFLLFGTADCETMQVRYFLLAKTLENETEEYGVCVEREGEQAVIPGLTSSQREVQKLLSRMQRGTVTPVTARDIADDWLLRDLPA